jgi:hypothetical protein
VTENWIGDDGGVPAKTVNEGGKGICLRMYAIELLFSGSGIVHRACQQAKKNLKSFFQNLLMPPEDATLPAKQRRGGGGSQINFDEVDSRAESHFGFRRSNMTNGAA